MGEKSAIGLKIASWKTARARREAEGKTRDSEAPLNAGSVAGAGERKPSVGSDESRPLAAVQDRLRKAAVEKMASVVGKERVVAKKPLTAAELEEYTNDQNALFFESMSQEDFDRKWPEDRRPVEDLSPEDGAAGITPVVGVRLAKGPVIDADAHKFFESLFGNGDYVLQEESDSTIKAQVEQLPTGIKRYYQKVLAVGQKLGLSADEVLDVLDEAKFVFEIDEATSVVGADADAHYEPDDNRLVFSPRRSKAILERKETENEKTFLHETMHLLQKVWASRQQVEDRDRAISEASAELVSQALARRPGESFGLAYASLIKRTIDTIASVHGISAVDAVKMAIQAGFGVKSAQDSVQKAYAAAGIESFATEDPVKLDDSIHAQDNSFDREAFVNNLVGFDVTPGQLDGAKNIEELHQLAWENVDLIEEANVLFKKGGLPPKKMAGIPAIDICNAAVLALKEMGFDIDPKIVAEARQKENELRAKTRIDNEKIAITKEVKRFANTDEKLKTDAVLRAMATLNLVKAFPDGPARDASPAAMTVAKSLANILIDLDNTIRGVAEKHSVSGVIEDEKAYSVEAKSAGMKVFKEAEERLVALFKQGEIDKNELKMLKKSITLSRAYLSKFVLQEGGEFQAHRFVQDWKKKGLVW